MVNLFRFIIILLAVFLVSCSPSRRLSRLLDKHPELVETTTRVVIDTVQLPERKGSLEPIEIVTIDWDSVLNMLGTIPNEVINDYVVVKKDSEIVFEDDSASVVVKIDSLGNMKADYNVRDGPVIIEREVKDTVYTVKEKKRFSFQWLLTSTIVILALIVVIKIIQFIKE